MTAQTSGREDFFLHDVQAHNLGRFTRLEVALHRIGHLLAEILHRVRLGEDGFSQSARYETDSTPNSMLPAPSSILAALRKEAA